MTWNKQRAQAAVAAKERKRISAVDCPADLPASLTTPRAKADFIIRIESARGERLQVSIVRACGRVRTSTGQSARQFCRGLEQLITKSA